MPKSRRRSVFVGHPSRQSIQIGGKYVNLSAISRQQNIDHSYLSRIFSGERIPRITHARKIALAIGMGLEEFLDALESRWKGLGQGTDDEYTDTCWKCRGKGGACIACGGTGKV